MTNRDTLIEFLLIEDDESHAGLVRLSFEQNNVSNRLIHMPTGKDGLSYLNGEGVHSGRQLPDVVLLDLNLPGMSGHEVLEQIRKNPPTAEIPVVVLTTSGSDSGRDKAYKFGANSYLTKPLEFDRFQEMVRDLQLYWGLWNQPPIASQMGTAE